MRIFAEVFIGDMVAFGVTLFEDALLTELLKGRQIRNGFTRLFVQMTHPLFLRPAFGKLLFHAKTFRQFAGHLINRLTLETRFNRLVSEDNVRHVPAGGIQRKVHLLRSSAIRQQNIGVFCRRSHMTVDNDDHFAFLVILQDFVGAINLRVLVNQTVASIVPDHFDRHVQLIFPPHAITQRRHFRAAFNGIGPHKHGDAGFNRIFQRGHTFKWQGIRPFARAAVTAVNPNITRQDRQHRDGARGDFSISMTLWPPPLANIGGFSAADFSRQLNNAIRRNTGNLRRPLRRLRNTVFTLAQNIGFVVTVFRRAGRQGFFVITDAIFIQERLIDHVLGD